MLNVSLNLTEVQSRLVASYVTRTKTTVELALLTQSVDSIIQQEAWYGFQSLVSSGDIPMAVVVAAESISSKVV